MTTSRPGFRGVMVNCEGASPTFSITSSRSMRTLVLPGRVSQPAAFRTSRASSFRNSIPISSSTRIAPLWIARTCSAESGSVGRSWLTGIPHGICLIAGPAPRRFAALPPDRRVRRRATISWSVVIRSYTPCARVSPARFASVPPVEPGGVSYCRWRPRSRRRAGMAAGQTGGHYPNVLGGRIRYTLRRFEPRAAHSSRLSSNASGVCASFQSRPPAV